LLNQRVSKNPFCQGGEYNNVNLINALKNMLDNAHEIEQENIEIPEEHQQLVLEQLYPVYEPALE